MDLDVRRTLIMQMRLNYRYAIVYFFIFIILAADSANAYQMCSWIGSQSSSANEENVQVVRLECDRGEVAWRYSRGALIVQIRAPNFNANDHPNARICYRLSKKHQNVLLYDMQGSSSSSQGLSLLFNSPEKTDDDHVTCTQLPRNGLVNLFVELHRQHSRSIQNSRAWFYYEIFRNSELRSAFDPADIRKDLKSKFYENPCSVRVSRYLNNHYFLAYL
uniref:Uncharacterized protein n=1 Tax=Romanomermis culicivorax TaxID=13658 RepID=A0A915L217_ROMCU